MSKENLGHIECEGCGCMANIRRRSNGRKLLYLSCVNCGLDQRSGDALQRKWAKACENPQSESQANQSEPIAEIAAPTALKVSSDEWTPPHQTNHQTNHLNSELGANDHDGTSTNEKDHRSGSTGKSSVFGWLGFAILATIAITSGARIRAS